MEVNSFLKDCPPFDALPEEQRNWAVSQLQSVYMNEENCNQILKDMKPALFIVRSGAYDLRGSDGRLIERLESGDLFGYPSLLSGREIVNKLKTKRMVLFTFYHSRHLTGFVMLQSLLSNTLFGLMGSVY